MTTDFVAVVLDATEPESLAHFWAHALGWDVEHGSAGGVALIPTDDTGFRLILRSAPSEKLTQNTIHFDLTTSSHDDQHDTVAALLTLGARHLDIGQGPEESHVVLADPEGNEFCVLAPGNQFLAGCPRLGAVNCDGTHALGSFWSKALEWPLVWDRDDETAIQSPARTGSKITWSGPPLMPKSATERLHLHIAPAPGVGTTAALERLHGLGATLAAGDAGTACPGTIGLVDVDGNRFCLVGP